MFDIVMVEHPIEGVSVDPAYVEWQTKDFDEPFMLRYRITAEGRLLEPIVHFEDRSDHNAPEGSFARFAGCMTSVTDGYRDMHYHGDLHFCGMPPGTTDVFLDCVARFTDGQLAYARLIPPSSPPSGAPTE